MVVSSHPHVQVEIVQLWWLTSQGQSQVVRSEDMMRAHLLRSAMKSMLVRMNIYQTHDVGT